jgi:hypothetical protein
LVATNDGLEIYQYLVNRGHKAEVNITRKDLTLNATVLLKTTVPGSSTQPKCPMNELTQNSKTSNSHAKTDEKEIRN